MNVMHAFNIRCTSGGHWLESNIKNGYLHAAAHKILFVPFPFSFGLLLFT